MPWLLKSLQKAEDKNGRNILFFDVVKKIMLTSDEFIMQIQKGIYSSYTVKNINGVLTPLSNPDNRSTNNLG